MKARTTRRTKGTERTEEAVRSICVHATRNTATRFTPPAFTLIEVLLAVAIFSMVLVAINTVFFASMRLRQRVTENVQEGLPLERALTLLRRDLQNAVPPGGVLAGNFSSSGPVGNLGTGQNKQGAAGNLSASANTGGLDFFTTTGALSADAPWGDIQEVNYQLMEPLDPANSYGRDLVRSVTRNILATATPTPDMQHLLSHVQNVNFEFFDGSQWREDWNTANGDSGLPLAVRAHIQLAPNEAAGELSQQPLEMVVLLETESLTNATQVAGGGQ